MNILYCWSWNANVPATMDLPSLFNGRLEKPRSYGDLVTNTIILFFPIEYRLLQLATLSDKTQHSQLCASEKAQSLSSVSVLFGKQLMSPGTEAVRVMFSLLMWHQHFILLGLDTWGCKPLYSSASGGSYRMGLVCLYPLSAIEGQSDASVGHVCDHLHQGGFYVCLYSISAKGGQSDA